jgi:hypothetical protein
MIDHFTRRFCFTLILYILHFGILGAGIFLEDTTTRIFFLPQSYGEGVESLNVSSTFSQCVCRS